jgi:hypothetical protein
LGDIESAVADFTHFLALYEEEDEHSAYAREYIQANTITGPKVTNLFFAKDIDENNEPVNVSDTFSSDTTMVYAFITYAGMTDGAPCESVWLIDEEEYSRTPFEWQLGSSGTSWITNTYKESGGPLESGTYRWELYVNSTLLASGEFIKE